MVWVYLFFPKFEAMKTNLIAILTGVSVVVLVSVSFISILKSAASEKTWIVAKGYRISEDVNGLQGPVAIAFLNLPGSKPEDPLYLVTELRGTIKVILNNRQVRKFGQLQGVHQPTHVLPDPRGAYGLHGLCLSRDDEYLFTTSVYRHENKLKNKITRWESDSSPKWLRGKPVAELSVPFENGQADSGHSGLPRWHNNNRRNEKPDIRYGRGESAGALDSLQGWPWRAARSLGHTQKIRA